MNGKQLIIIGAGGHGRVAADIARLNGYEGILFLDDNEDVHTCGNYPVAGAAARAGALPGDVFIGIGDSRIRRDFCERYRGRLVTLIHPDAVIAVGAEVGDGSVVMAGAVINPGSKVGAGCIVNTCASIDHDCMVGDYVHLAVGAHLSGTVTVGSNTWLGAGAVVSNNISICGDCIIGAGAVVVRNIEEPGTYVGVPAGKVRKMEKTRKDAASMRYWGKPGC